MWSVHFSTFSVVCSRTRQLWSPLRLHLPAQSYRRQTIIPSHVISSLKFLIGIVPLTLALFYSLLIKRRHCQCPSSPFPPVSVLAPSQDDDNFNSPAPQAASYKEFLGLLNSNFNTKSISKECILKRYTIRFIQFRTFISLMEKKKIYLCWHY